MTEPASAPAADRPAAPRVALVDVARGLALAAMFVFHFTWDLGHFGFITLQAGLDPGWRLFSRLIAGSFLVLVGIGLVLSTRDGLRPGPYLRRLVTIALAALAVTLATRWMDPETFVYFGILHCIAASSILALPALRAPPWWTAFIAALVMAAPAILRSPAYEGPLWWWTGLSARVPQTSDYEPILPWFGCVLAGVALARFAVDRGWDRQLAAWRPTGPLTRLLERGGRHSLTVYLVHQPVFFGLLSLAVAAGVPRAIPPLPDEIPSVGGFVAACTRTCQETGVDRAFCLATCACVDQRLAGSDIGERALRNAMTAADQSRLKDAAIACRAGGAP
jgi:uncharacterized membrane protein